METFAGKDLLRVHTESQEKGVERRRTLQTKLSSMRDITPVTQIVNEETGDGQLENGPVKEAETKGPTAEVTEKPEAEKSGKEEKGEGEGAPVHRAFCDVCAVCSVHCTICFALAYIQFVSRTARTSEGLGGSAWYARTTTFVTNAGLLEFTMSTKCSRSKIPKTTSKPSPP